MDAIKSLKQMLAGRRNDAMTRLHEFAERVLREPSEALAWSKTYFEAAAKEEVARRLLGAIEKGQTDIEHLHRHAVGQALKGAQYPPASSSAPSNFMATCLTAAWASVAEDLAGYVALEKAKAK